jgi:hypothetical protein
MQAFQPPQMFAPTALQLPPPPPPPMHTQPPSVVVPSWPNPSAHPQAAYSHPPHQPPPPPK